jgi:uncharacterized protein (UPF0332 family)
MRRIPFLNKIHNEGKLKLVDPSTEIKDAYLQRANESLSSAKVLLDIGNLKDTVALAYYAMYHTLLALLFRTGIKCENHTAAIILLKEVFAIDNSSISKAKEERVDKQYYIDFAVTKEDVKDCKIRFKSPVIPV